MVPDCVGSEYLVSSSKTEYLALNDPNIKIINADQLHIFVQAAGQYEFYVLKRSTTSFLFDYTQAFLRVIDCLEHTLSVIAPLDPVLNRHVINV